MTFQSYSDEQQTWCCQAVKSFECCSSAAVSGGNGRTVAALSCLTSKTSLSSSQDGLVCCIREFYAELALIVREFVN